MSSDLLLLGINPSTTTYGWGVSPAGELDNNEKFYNFVESPTLIGDKSFSVVLGGSAFAYGLDGTDLWAWGAVNLRGIPLYGNSSPVQISGAWTKVAVSSFAGHTLAIKTDGTLWAWGPNTYGQLGDGTVVSKSSPVQIGALTTWIDAAVGANFSLALRSDNTVWAFGRNNQYQLGQATSTANASSPVQVSGGSGFTKIFAAGYTGFGIKSNGTLWGWGANNTNSVPVVNYYMLAGAVAVDSQSAPVQIGSDTTWTDLATNTYSAFGFKTNDVWVWGANSNYILGVAGGTQSSPVQLAGSWAKITAGAYTTYGIKTDGSLWSWGYPGNLCWLGANYGTTQQSPVLVNDSKSWVSIGAASPAVLANTDEVGSNLYGWGGMYNGSLSFWDPVANGYQLYDKRVVSLSSPVQFVSQLDKFSKVYLGGTLGVGYSGPEPVAAAGITKNKQLYMWGSNAQGQLGDGTIAPKSSPVLISSDAYESMALGYQATYALKTDGTVWAWGSNSYGKLGDGSEVSRSSPVQFGALTNFTGVAAGVYSFFATTSTNYLYASGLNADGVWGNGSATTNRSSSPVLIATDIVKVFIRENTSFFIKANGSLWSSGRDKDGSYATGLLALGAVGYTYTTNAQQVVGTYTYPWVKVSPAGTHVLGLTSDGTLWGWGSNQAGQLATAAAVGTSAVSPLVITTGVSDMFARNYGSYFIKGGRLYGLGRAVLSGTASSPVLIGSATGWQSITSSNDGYNTLGIANP